MGLRNLVVGILIGLNALAVLFVGLSVAANPESGGVALIFVVTLSALPLAFWVWMKRGLRPSA